MSVQSYSNTESTGKIKIRKRVKKKYIKNRNIIIVEDILDSGFTLNFLQDFVQSRTPISVECAVLLSKPSQIKKPIAVKYLGFEIDNLFVIGYGLDYNEYFRNLPFIAVPTDETIQKFAVQKVQKVQPITPQKKPQKRTQRIHSKKHHSKRTQKPHSKRTQKPHSKRTQKPHSKRTQHEPDHVEVEKVEVEKVEVDETLTRYCYCENPADKKCPSCEFGWGCTECFEKWSMFSGKGFSEKKELCGELCHKKHLDKK